MGKIGLIQCRTSSSAALRPTVQFNQTILPRDSQSVYASSVYLHAEVHELTRQSEYHWMSQASL